jgi:hypothetical protein
MSCIRSESNRLGIRHSGQRPQRKLSDLRVKIDLIAEAAEETQSS